VYFMSTVCGRPQGGREGGPAHVDACGQGGEGQKRDYFVDVINGWPHTTLAAKQGPWASRLLAVACGTSASIVYALCWERF